MWGGAQRGERTKAEEENTLIDGLSLKAHKYKPSGSKAEGAEGLPGKGEL